MNEQTATKTPKTESQKSKKAPKVEVKAAPAKKVKVQGFKTKTEKVFMAQFPEFAPVFKKNKVLRVEFKVNVNGREVTYWFKVNGTPEQGFVK